MTQQMNWLETHLGSINETIEIVNKFHWELRIIEHDKKWYITTGGPPENTVIFSADNRDAVDAFLYGMGLAYVGIPSPLFERLEEDIKQWYEHL